MLALNGSEDIQVIADSNLKAIKEGLKKGGNTAVTTQKLSGLNHLFQKCKTCTINEYGQLEETFSTEALKIIYEWLRYYTQSKK